jgi:ABC-type uncharacterized transport system auxiliary subunit
LCKNVVAIVCAAAVLAMLGACDREEQAHEVHLSKGTYAGKPMTKLDDKQIAELKRRAEYGDF